MNFIVILIDPENKLSIKLRDLKKFVCLPNVFRYNFPFIFLQKDIILINGPDITCGQCIFKEGQKYPPNRFG
jgi:hypothetical protein